eukprot:6184456-Pleurochrysis_carterae.AAC.1
MPACLYAGIRTPTHAYTNAHKRSTLYCKLPADDNTLRQYFLCAHVRIMPCLMNFRFGLPRIVCSLLRAGFPEDHREPAEDAALRMILAANAGDQPILMRANT